MVKKILFVDDEPRVLQGLQRMLRCMISEWEMKFVESGQAALDLMSQEQFDVLVTDMRMPGMDGAQLLTRVKELYPSVIRIVLSGQSDRETILKSVRPAHQYLSKPCDAENLKSTITRAFALRDLLGNKDLKHIVSKIDALPSMPALYKQIMEELSSDDPSLRKVGEIISKDVGMTAKMLQLVNSAFFGMYNHISNPIQAVNLLGLDTIKALVMTVQIFSQFKEKAISQHYLEVLWMHSLRTGQCSRYIAMAELNNKQFVDDVFMAGLLHDIGKLVLLVNFPKEYKEVVQAAKVPDISCWESESVIFGTTHAEIGAYLMGIWGLSDPIVEAIAYHHFPSRCPHKCISPLAMVHVVDAILNHEPENGEAVQGLDKDFLEQLTIMDSIPKWKELCQKGTEEQLVND
ncbi:MAG: hypothetical protein A2X42_04315 [Candidatus Margulisbacteria bacterium GWF2_38_17]|nr:MAG: hypothetical protein A2X43_11790 [Candidatus Margulisbacteria bacterium GWD2_39_127]OGI01821.1 MAG: hypothetical protein A2X42_04315 [Candidatus Margulisbacteria bacterium GWF2_38_17]OGI10143.1 MAG: hypothetical protein A2X41_01035 [Candidatus Margulisbacteria bacterium GWE2_39_32]